MPNRATGINAITLLEKDHETVRGLLDKLDATTERAGETREKLLAKIEQELKVHTKIEEEIFYPAYKAAVSKCVTPRSSARRIRRSASSRGCGGP